MFLDTEKKNISSHDVDVVCAAVDGGGVDDGKDGVGHHLTLIAIRRCNYNCTCRDGHFLFVC